MLKVIVDGAVIQAATPKLAGRELARARTTGARQVRVRVVPRFPASMQERDMTGAEQAAVLAAAVAALA